MIKNLKHKNIKDHRPKVERNHDEYKEYNIKETQKHAIWQNGHRIFPLQLFDEADNFLNRDKAIFFVSIVICKKIIIL